MSTSSCGVIPETNPLGISEVRLGYRSRISLLFTTRMRPSESINSKDESESSLMKPIRYPCRFVLRTQARYSWPMAALG